MNEDEANTTAAALKALMPKMTDAQLVAVRNCLRSQVDDVEAARRRLFHYAESNVDFNLALALSAARGFTDQAARTQRMLEQERAQAAALQEEWQRIEAAIAAVDDARLAAMKQSALHAQPTAVARALADKDPRTCRRLLGLMAAQLGVAPSAAGRP